MYVLFLSRGGIHFLPLGSVSTKSRPGTISVWHSEPGTPAWGSITLQDETGEVRQGVAHVLSAETGLRISETLDRHVHTHTHVHAFAHTGMHIQGTHSHIHVRAHAYTQNVHACMCTNACLYLHVCICTHVCIQCTHHTHTYGARFKFLFQFECLLDSWNTFNTTVQDGNVPVNAFVF